MGGLVRELVHSFRDIYSDIGDKELSEIAAVKRFSELYSSDPKLRELIELNHQTNIYEYLREYDIDKDLPSDFIKDITTATQIQSNNTSALDHGFLSRWKSFHKKRVNHRDKLRSFAQEGIDDHHLSAWRERVVAQNEAHMSPQFLENNVYPLFAIELSDGCSVGCPFCGIGAEGLKQHYPACEKNISLFTDVIETIKASFGKNAGISGFLYWATDPLDNPDYEIFQNIYEDTFSVTPQLTTAIPHKHLERVRLILGGRGEKNISPHRFSVLTMGILKRLYKEFSAVDLIDVEIIPQMKGSLVVKANAGKNYNEDNIADDEIPETIACVAGFLINMVKKEIKLVTPCKANNEYPLGYITHDSHGFTDQSGLEKIFSFWKRTYFDIKPKSNDLIQLSPIATLVHKENQILLETSNTSYDISVDITAQKIVQILSDNKAVSTRELILKTMENNTEIFSALNAIYKFVRIGVVDVKRLEKSAPLVRV